MFLLKKLLYILCLTFLLVHKTKCYYFDIVKENVFKKTEDETCFRRHYVNFKGELIQICLYYKSTIYPKYIYNIHIYKIKEGNQWEKKFELLRDNTTQNIRYFYTFSTNEKIIVIFCYSKPYFKIPCECYYSTSYDGELFDTQRTLIDYEIFDILSLTDYYLKPFNFMGENLLLICGVNYRRIIQNNSKLFIICHGSSNDGKSWNEKLNFYYPKTDMYSSYFMVVPKISGNEFGFRFVISSEKQESKYIKCKYRSSNDFDCSDVNLSIDGKVMRDVVKYGGYYLTNQSEDGVKPCQFYYIYNSVVLAPSNMFEQNGLKCVMEHFFPLDNNRLIFNYKDVNYSYTYIFRHTGYVKHCTLLYINKDNLNPGFIKEKGNIYTCSIQYDELPTDGDYRIFVLSVLNEVKTDLSKCFDFSYDKILYPVNIIQKIKTVTEYDKYKLYIFHIKKDLEHFFLKDRELKCDLGNNFRLKLITNYRNSFILDNTSSNVRLPLILHSNNIIYYRIPRTRSKNPLFYHVTLPPYTKYVMAGETLFLFKLPPFIKDRVQSHLFFISNWKKIVKQPIIYHEGGKIPDLVGVNFANMNESCSYGYASNKCSHLKMEGNKITIDVVHTDTKAILGMICPADATHQSICFNHVYDNDKKVFIRDFFEDTEGFLTILPKAYVHVPKSSVRYEESILIMEKEFLEKFYKNRSHYKDSFVCKCYADKKLYEVTFKLL